MTSSPEQPLRWSPGRLEAFSDGVLAIAITLLVLEIKIEPSEFDHLWRALADEWPSYLAYVTSFLTIGAVWLAHHALFVRLQRDRPGPDAAQPAAADGGLVPAVPDRR